MGSGLGTCLRMEKCPVFRLCPVHPVEKLYSENVLMTLPNAHCHECMNCVIPCPDSTPNIHPQSPKRRYGRDERIFNNGRVARLYLGLVSCARRNQLYQYIRISGCVPTAICVHDGKHSCCTVFCHAILKELTAALREHFAAAGVFLLLLVQDTFFVRFWQFRSTGFL